MQFDGTLKTWNDERGFGFIEPIRGGDEVFVHIKAFDNRSERPSIGQRLTFEVETGPNGKKRAKRVQAAQSRRTMDRPVPHRRKASPAQWGTASYFAIPAFVLLYLICAVLWRIPHWVAGLYLVASAACFIFYAVDKSAAGTNRRRIPERTLILLGLACGWPGAIIAQQLLRHKSSKASFRSVFWGSVVLNVAAFVALASPLASPLVSVLGPVLVSVLRG